MSEEKFKRVVVASTVGAVLLLVILLSVMIYGIVKIIVTNKKIDELDNLVAYYNGLSDEIKEQRYYVGLKDYIEQEAKKLGYRYKWDD